MKKLILNFEGEQHELEPIKSDEAVVTGNSDLLSCPFCGSSCKMTDTTFGDSRDTYYRVECTSGHALDNWEDTPEDAARYWDTRTT
jgi:hypothetical protein